MSARVTLDQREILALRQAIYAVRVQPEVANEIGAELLAVIDRKLERAVTRLCVHCGDRETRRSNGLCDRCHTYSAKYGVLPSEETLTRTSTRRSATRSPAPARPRTRSDRAGP